MPKKFYETNICGNFIKLFWLNLCSMWHNQSQNPRQYAGNSINYAETSFYEIGHWHQSYEALLSYR
jgi:hypothetical protein